MLSLDLVPRLDSQRGSEGRPLDDGRGSEHGGQDHGGLHQPLLLVPALRRELRRQSDPPGLLAGQSARQHHVALADTQHGQPSLERFLC